MVDDRKIIHFSTMSILILRFCLYLFLVLQSPSLAEEPVDQEESTPSQTDQDVKTTEEQLEDLSVSPFPFPLFNEGVEEKVFFSKICFYRRNCREYLTIVQFKT